MRKSTKIISVLILLFTIFAGLGSSMMETAQADTPSNVSVTLHKKKMTSIPDPLVQNTGKEMSSFSQYDDTPNVEFTVYDMTDEFYNLRAGNMPVDDAMSEVANNPAGDSITTGVTGADGKVTFSLPAKSDNRDAVYVFVETDAPGGTERASNMALVLPMFNEEDNVMTNILLYPKNEVKADGQVTVTKKGTANNEPLSNAKFIVSRELTTGNTEYLADGTNSTSGLHLWTDDPDQARIFVTGTSGQFTIENLEHGDYELIEVESPDNASIIDEGVRKFTINDQNTILSFDVYNDTIDVDKEHTGDDIDYEVGELIPYSISVNVPEGMSCQFSNGTYRHPSLIITDAPDPGLRFNNDLTMSANGTPITIETGWLVPTGNGFRLEIPAAALADFEGDELTLSYNMYLDGTAEPDKGYNNLATVSTTELKDEDDTPEVFTGGYRFLKIDANSETTKLEDAVFVVGRGEENAIEYLVIGADNAVSWTSDKDSATEFTSNSDGIVEVAGLEYGAYWIQEIAAPEGYVLSEAMIPFTVDSGTFTKIDPFEIKNVHKGRLPSTGGSGILGIVAIGATLVATTGGYYIKRKREE